MMQRLVDGRLSARRPVLFVSCAIVALLAPLGAAQADTPEYWSKETFHTERPIIASLSPTDEESRPARRTAPRASVADSDDDDQPSPRRRARAAPKAKSKPVRVASLGRTYAPAPKPAPSVSGGGGIRWVASAGCLNGTLRGVLAQVAARFGSVTVNSTCRSRGHNARVGGAPRSMHLSGDAADFRIHGNWGAAAGFIRGMVGGFKHYGGGLFHIDTGSKRTW